MDPEFLMEIMEINEDLEDATGKDDVRTIGLKNQNKLNDLLRYVVHYGKHHRKTCILIRHINQLYHPKIVYDSVQLKGIFCISSLRVHIAP